MSTFCDLMKRTQYIDLKKRYIFYVVIALAKVCFGIGPYILS